MEYLAIAEDLEETIEWIEDAEGQSPLLVATSAREMSKKGVSFDELRNRLKDDSRPVYLLFGTGWGMTEELIDVCDVILPPIMGNSEFNHLSVRAAVAIMLDRVAGDRDEC
jgi:hypothetical protein